MTARIRFRSFLTFALVIASVTVITVLQRPERAEAQNPQSREGLIRPLAQGSEQAIANGALQSIEKGRETFRFDTFGDEAFWGDTLNLDATIAGAANGGIGPGLSPRQALDLGLKVDVDALPGALKDQLRAGEVNLDDPAITVAPLQLNAVVGVKGFFSNGELSSVGIQCALCHSTVDNSLIEGIGIGRRLDGWANRDLNVGAIVAFAPDLSAFATLLGVSEDTVRQVLNSWGPGKFDAELSLDGKAFRPDGKTAATLIPPAFGLAGVNLHTWTGWGSVTHWNAFVANLEMHGKGTFFDPRLNDAAKFPIAAANGFGNVRTTPDLITRKLADLHFYQLAIPAPAPPNGSFSAAAAGNSSPGKQRARRATFRRSSRSRGGTCTLRPKSESTTSRRSGRPTNGIGRLP